MKDEKRSGAAPSGPYLQMALVCEKALQESDGVLSIIRVIDRIMHTIQGPTPPAELPPLVMQLTIVVALKSGKARGRHTLTLEIEAPSGQKQARTDLPVHFEGDADRGVNIILNTTFQATMEGLYWFDLFLDQENLLTRMPLRVLYRRIATSPEPG